MFKQFIGKIKGQKNFADIANKYVDNGSKLVKVSTTIGCLCGFMSYYSYIDYKDEIKCNIEYVKVNKYKPGNGKIMSDDDINEYISLKTEELEKEDNMFDIEYFPHSLNLSLSTFFGGALGVILSRYYFISVPSLFVFILVNNQIKKNKSSANNSK